MTNSAHFSQITDELLSAYLDQEITAAEKNWVEAAVTTDPEIAWRLETLRQTVQLLHILPAVALPRSFVLTKAQLAAAREPLAARNARSVPALLPSARSAPSSWQTLLESWRNFWQAGSPLLRNAMAASFALLLVLVVGDSFLSARLPDQLQTRSAQETEIAVVPTQPPTAVAVNAPAGAPAAPPASAPDAAAATVNTEVVEAAAASQENAPNPSQGSAMRSSTATAQEAFAASVSSGEDTGVDLAPGEPAFPSATLADESGAGGGGENAAVARLPPSGQAAAKQADVATTTTTVTSAAFVSPLDTPALAMSTANDITATTAITQTGGAAVVAEPITPAATSGLPLVADTVTAAVAALPAMVPAEGSTVALTSTAVTSATADDWSLPPTIAGVDPLPLNSPLQVEPTSASATAPTERLRLLQIVSALVTLVLAGLWWRSR